MISWENLFNDIDIKQIGGHNEYTIKEVVIFNTEFDINNIFFVCWKIILYKINIKILNKYLFYDLKKMNASFSRYHFKCI